MNASSRLNAWARLQKSFEQSLPAFLYAQRWFGGKTRIIREVEIVDFIPVPLEGANASILLARVAYADNGSETYAVPFLEHIGLSAGTGESNPAPGGPPKLKIPADGAELLFTDALWDRAFLAKLLDSLAASARLPGSRGEMVGLPTPAMETLHSAAHLPLEPSLMKVEQSNTSVLYGRCFVLKFFRRVEEGVNPDFEIGEFLTVRAGFRHVPPAAGSFEYRRPGARPATMGILQGYVANDGDAWGQTLLALDGFYDRVERAAASAAELETPGPRPLEEARQPLPEAAARWVGDYRSTTRLLGQRTAQLHLALASDPNDPDFAPEPFSLDHQREISTSMIQQAEEAFGMLRRREADLPAALRGRAREALAAEREILGRFRFLEERPLTGLRTRIHGDLHLGQILATGDDFVFIDFEGEPARTLAERRAKHSPLRDVAGMLRSFHYAAYAALFRRAGDAAETDPRFVALAGFANRWYRWVSSEFIRGYLETAAAAPFLPSRSDELEFFLNLWLLDKAVYELKYEMNHRLTWVAIPLEGICGLVASGG